MTYKAIDAFYLQTKKSGVKDTKELRLRTKLYNVLPRCCFGDSQHTASN